jgi:hypothetical protein
MMPKIESWDNLPAGVPPARGSSCPQPEPLVKARVNAVDSMVCPHSGQRRLLVDPKCQGLIKDFEPVSWKSGSQGNLQRDLDTSELLRTHVSDAVGYWVVREHPLRDAGGFMSGPRIL